MEYDSPYKSDSPFSYEVEEGELSCESGRSSPGTIRDCASDCGTQTETNMITDDEKIKTFRVELENETQIVQTPQEIARKIQNKFVIDEIFNLLILVTIILTTYQNKEQI